MLVMFYIYFWKYIKMSEITDLAYYKETEI